MKVLIVDDSKAIRMILAKTLSDIGCDIFEAQNGRDALIIMSANAKPDLICVDWNMPEMNGFDFVQQLRSSPENDSIKLLMITTESEFDNVTAAKLAGVDEYIIKPFNTEIILTSLHKMGFSLATSPLNMLRKIKGMAAIDDH